MSKRNVRIPWQSKITDIKEDQLSTHGVDQTIIIREFSYEDMVFFLLKGRRPNHTERCLLRAVIVSHISHGITGQSTLAVMMAADCRSDFLHALVAGFSVGAGKYHQGGLRATMMELQALGKISSGLTKHIQRRLSHGDRIMGFGHRFHREDPRAKTLVSLAEELGFNGHHLKTVRRVERILKAEKNISMNIEAAGGAILLDLGFDPSIAHLIIVIGRSPMYAAVYLERLNQNRDPFQQIEVVDVLKANDV